MMKAMQAKNNETMKTHDENHVKSNDTMTHDEQEEAYVKKNEHMMSNDENRVTRGENMVKYGEHNEKHLRNESMKNMVENGRFSSSFAFAHRFPRVSIDTFVRKSVLSSKQVFGFCILYGIFLVFQDSYH